jgi:hypothetical protein
MSSFDTEAKLTAGVIAIIIVAVTAITLFAINQSTKLNHYRIEHGYNECQQIGQAGTVWVKGPCPGQY